MKITSSAFLAGREIPSTYTQEGEGSNPPLTISEVPADAKSLALIVDDPDAPRGTFTHWIVFNVDPRVGVILNNSVPLGAIQGKNDAGVLAYRGPKPPSGTHRYYFKVYALDCRLVLAEGVSRGDLEEAMQDHLLATGEVMGLYTTRRERTETKRD